MTQAADWARAATDCRNLQGGVHSLHAQLRKKVAQRVTLCAPRKPALAARLLEGNEKLSVSSPSAAVDALLCLLESPATLHARVVDAARAVASEQNRLVLFTPARPAAGPRLLVLHHECLEMGHTLALLADGLVHPSGGGGTLTCSVEPVMWLHLWRCGPLLEELASVTRRHPAGEARSLAYAQAFASAAKTPRRVLELLHSGFSFLGLDGHAGRVDLRGLAAARMAALLRPHAVASDVGTLRRLLGVVDPCMSDAQAAEACAEPLFSPAEPAPPALARGWSRHSDHEPSLLIECLEQCDARTLRALKAVLTRWGERARRCLALDAWRAAMWGRSHRVKADGKWLPENGSVDDPVSMKMAAADAVRDLDPAVELPAHVLQLADLLDPPLGDSWAQDRAQQAAVAALLCRVEPPALLLHLPALLCLLAHGSADVQRAAGLVLKGVEPSALELHSGPLLHLLEEGWSQASSPCTGAPHAAQRVRLTVLRLLAKVDSLEPRINALLSPFLRAALAGGVDRGAISWTGKNVERRTAMLSLSALTPRALGWSCRTSMMASSSVRCPRIAPAARCSTWPRR